MREDASSAGALLRAALACGAALAACTAAALAGAGVDDPAKTIGPGKGTGCGECHGNELLAWQTSAHARGFEELHRSARAKEIAEKLGVKRVKRGAACADCHYTLALQDKGPEPVAGISCESCHGPGKDWAKVHSNKDDPQRLAKAEELGMVRPHRVYELAARCFACHTVPDERVVNVGGHAAGGDIELVSWSQGEVRHGFLRGQGKTNAEAGAELRRRLYVVGRLVEIEMGLRALGKATTDGPYAKAAAARIEAARGHAGAIAGALGDGPAGAPVRDALAALDGLELTPGNAHALAAAAGKVEAAARRFSGEQDGSKLGALDALIPGPEALKGKVWQP